MQMNAAPSTAPIRYGIIGTGAMGLEHIRNIALMPDATVVAFADDDATSTQRAVDLLGDTALAFTDYRDLIAHPDVDALIICTPNFHHIEVLREAIPSGKHILCEKPLCTTIEDCQEVQKAVQDYPGVFWVAMEYRYMPPVARLIKEVRAGTVGDVKMVSIREHRFPFLTKVSNWNRFNRNTGGTLTEKCCHFFDLMCHITQAKPVRVMASGAQDVNHKEETYDGETPDIIDNAMVIFDFDNGARAHLDLCMFAEASKNQEEILAVGPQGKVEASCPDSMVHIGRRNALEPERTPPEDLHNVEAVHIPVDKALLEAGYHEGSTFYELTNFGAACRNNSPPEVSVDDGTLAVAMGLAAHKSIAEGRMVQMDELLPE